MRHRYAPLVNEVLVDFHFVLIMRQAFTGPSQAHLPRAQLLHGLLKLDSEARWVLSTQGSQVKAAQETRPGTLPLKRVSAQVLGTAGPHVLKACYIDPIGTLPDVAHIL